MPGIQENSKRNRKKKRFRRIILIELVILLIIVAVVLFIFVFKEKDKAGDKNNTTQNNSQTKDPDNSASDDKDTEDELTKEELAAKQEQERLKKEEQDRKDLIAQADLLAKGYDYDAAIELIKTYKGSEGGYEVYPVLTSAISGYETTKSSLVLYGGTYTSVTQINHIFFHSLIADNSKAFDGEYDEEGYNMYMTTTSEFEKMMQKMYEDGYVLVSMHDIAKQVTASDGTVEFEPGEIYLPQGKKPFVLSQDDVNYYDYMAGDGFASRIVIGEDGKPTCEMIQDDGTRITGDFDVVPLLDKFVEEHPDFSYKGAKGLLAITGYEGTLG
jgi:competence protein ComGC